MSSSNAIATGVISGGLGTSLISLASALLLHCLRRRSGTKYEQLSQVDELEDGQVVSQRLRAATISLWKRRICLCAVLTGIALSSLRSWADQFTLNSKLILACWTTAFPIAVLVAFDSPELACLFRNALHLAICSLAATVALIADLASEQWPLPVTETSTLSAMALILLGAAQTWWCLSIPQGPADTHRGRIIDEQMTTSIIRRYTFSWIWPLLRQARAQGSLELENLPSLDHKTRAGQLYGVLPSEALHQSKVPLWRTLIRDHSDLFIRQWSVAFIESIVAMLPPFCLYKILFILESRASVDGFGKEALLWAFGLVVSKMVHAGLDAWVNWVSFAICAMPIRSRLSILIFSKLLKAKCGVDQTSRRSESHNSGPSGEDADTVVETNKSLPHDDTENDEDDEVVNGVVNLLAVDVQRISEFAGYNVDLLRGLVKISLASLLLIFILGWQSTLAGLLIPILLQPVSRIATKHYTSKQLQVMAARDEKAFVVSEVLQGIRQIKFSATEDFWQKTILKAREKEIRTQWSVFIWAIFLTLVWMIMPIVIGATSLSVYALQGKDVVPSAAFTAMSLFGSLEFTIGAIPNTITEMLDALVSSYRVQRHLKLPEVVNDAIPADAIEFENATIAWPSLSAHVGIGAFTLRNLNLRFPPGKLSVIYGSTAVGKSLLLAAIIGEAELLSGTIKAPVRSISYKRERDHPDEWIRPNTFAFVSQQPWIENASVRSIVLYGLPYHPRRYADVLHASALDQDMDVLPDGDETEIGPTGVNLSGGQRWRLTFARALYSRASVLVLDDIFSAVDAHVGKHLLQHGICGTLATGRTIILVTHHVDLVEPVAGYIVNLDDRTTKTRENVPLPAKYGAGVWSATVKGDNGDEDEEERPSHRVQAKTFVSQESRQKGWVKLQVYKAYFTASRAQIYWTITLGFFALATVTSLGRSYWLAVWTDQYTKEIAPIPMGSSHSPSNHDLRYYLGVYIGLSGASIVFTFAKISIVLFSSLQAARHLFQVAISRVLRAPLRWLDTEPSGRVLNRFVGDFALVDSKLGGDMMWCANGAFRLVVIVVASLFLSVWMLVPVLVLSLLGIYTAYLYIAGARDMKRLESTSKSPIFELVRSVASGLSTIRAFGRSDAYMERMCDLIDGYTRSSWYVLLASQWMRFRQGMLGATFTLSVALGVVCFPTNASLAGLALSLALEYSDVVENTITRYTAVELDMNSVERIAEYTELAAEPEGGDLPAIDWPSQGKIQVQDLRVGYADDLPPVLKDISFDVRSGERVGIVGRTGSGKSSLTLALFRFLRARSGTIKIDDLDIQDVNLHELRSRIAIIPQDPVLFTGTIRSNLDPGGLFPDEILSAALKRVHLTAHMQDQNDMSILESPVTRTNLSQGQKQLLCLARAIITRPKILILDEATSAVDMRTDALIQKSIREDFTGCTLLVVAHRLSTVADFDRLLVMSDGKVVEYDTPYKLARLSNGVFRGMIESSSEVHALRDLL